MAVMSESPSRPSEVEDTSDQEPKLEPEPPAEYGYTSALREQIRNQLMFGGSDLDK